MFFEKAEIARAQEPNFHFVAGSLACSTCASTFYIWEDMNPVEYFAVYENKAYICEGRGTIPLSEYLIYV